MSKWVVVFSYVTLMLFVSGSFKTRKKASPTRKSEEITEEQTNKNTSESNEITVKLVNNIEPMKFFKPKPNFFLAFPVNSVHIHLNVKKLQEKLIAKNPSLFPALIKISTLHVTLAVTHLAHEIDIETFKDKLDEWAEKNIKKFFCEPCILTFSGVKTFNNVVAYVDIVQCSNYKKISELSNSLNNLLSSAGFPVDLKKFRPHLTFLKLSKDFKLIKLKKNFKKDFELLKKCKDHFGKQEITSLQLLSMNEPKDEIGYYKCYHQINVPGIQLMMDHSECCSPILKPKSLVQKKFKNILNKSEVTTN